MESGIPEETLKAGSVYVRHIHTMLYLCDVVYTPSRQPILVWSKNPPIPFKDAATALIGIKNITQDAISFNAFISSVLFTKE